MMRNEYKRRSVTKCVRTSGRRTQLPALSTSCAGAAHDPADLGSPPSPGSPGTAFAQFSSYSFLGYFSSISSAGSCPASWPLDAGRPQGLDESPSLSSLHVSEPPLPIQTEAAVSPQSLCSQASPLSSRPRGIYSWVPTRPLQWNRPDRGPLFHPRPHAHTVLLGLPLHREWERPAFQEASLLPPSPHPTMQPITKFDGFWPLKMPHIFLILSPLPLPSPCHPLPVPGSHSSRLPDHPPHSSYSDLLKLTPGQIIPLFKAIRCLPTTRRITSESLAMECKDTTGPGSPCPPPRQDQARKACAFEHIKPLSPLDL